MNRSPMIWGSPRRQYTWLAVGARTFALLTLAMPLLLSHNQLMLLALLAIGAIWAAVTAGELLEIPATLLLVLDAALVGSIAGLSSALEPAVLGALAVPPFTAGLRRGTRGVALSLSAELATFVLISFAERDPHPGPGQRRVHVGGHRARPGPDRVVRPCQLPRRQRPAARLPRRAGADPRADRAVRAAELRPRPGRARWPDREPGPRRAAGGGADGAHPARRGPDPARRRHQRHRPRAGDQPRSSPSTAC